MPHWSHSPGFTQCIQFIDENHAGSFFFRLHKQITYPGGADSDKHLHELRSTNRKKRNSCLTSNRLGQESFPRPRRTNEKDTFGDFPTETAKLLGPFKKFNDLLQLGFSFLDPGNVTEPDLNILLHVDFRLAFANREKAATHALLVGRSAHEKDPDAKEQKDWHGPGEQVLQSGVLHLTGKFHLMSGKPFGQLRLHREGHKSLRLPLRRGF